MGWHRKRTAVGIVGVVGALTGLLAGCATSSGGADPGQGPRPVEAIASARALAGAPALVRQAEDPSCGEYVVDQGEELPEAARSCLVQAVDDRVDAVLAWTWPTTEGDPIVSFAFVHAGEHDVLVAETSAFDTYGGNEDPWSWSRCTEAADIGVRYEHCSETTAP